MAATREELREHLVAAIEAAPELQKEDREHLADVFLDQLHGDYDLVPRETGERPQSVKQPRRAAWGARWVPMAMVLAFLVIVLPATFHVHVPIFLLVVIAVFLAVRGSGWGAGRCRPLPQYGE